LAEGKVTGLEATAEGWLCRDASGRILAEAEAVCLAAGFDTAVFLPPAGLQPVRGQAEYTAEPIFTGDATAWGAYAIPTRDGGVLFGASHRRGDAGRDLRPDERSANLDALAKHRPALAERVRTLPMEGLRSRAAVRAAVRDHLPLAGRWGTSGLHVLSGLGGRGFTLAPLLAEHIAAEALGAPSPLPTSLARRLRPDRFAAENSSVGSPFP
jgi:tRNA 5-methylaminomethyl-2-thiouridine biosynthesis bifunctional protein